MKKTVFFALLALFMPLSVFAFTADWTDGNPMQISSVTSAHAYFGKLVEEPQAYEFSVTEPTRIFFTVLVPDLKSSKKDVSVAIVDTKATSVPLGVVLPSGEWTPFEYQGEKYLRGQAYRATVPAGNYRIIVWSSNNDSSYALVVGEQEQFILSKVAGAFGTLPNVEHILFGKSALSAFFAPIIFSTVIVVVILIALLVWLARRRPMAGRAL